jgi:hypothetical protein
MPVPNAGARGLAALAAAAVLVGGWLRLRAARRRERFGEQLPDVLDIVVRSLRAGHPLAVSLSLVAREMPAPAGPEFALVVDEVNYGRSITEALENLHARVGYPDLQFFVASTAIAHQTGGNLGEILSRLAALLRQRFRLKRRVRGPLGGRSLQRSRAQHLTGRAVFTHQPPERVLLCRVLDKPVRPDGRDRVPRSARRRQPLDRSARELPRVTACRAKQASSSSRRSSSRA